MSIVNLSRRSFLRSSAVVGGGLVLGFSLTGCSGDAPLPIDTSDGSSALNAFLQLYPDNSMKFYVARDEMGQGVTTGLATLFAEEFDVDPAHFEIAFAGVHSDYNNPGMGVQATGGSNAINAHYLPLRQAGADTRALIIAAAAKDLGVAKAEISTDNGQVIVGGESYPYGQFVDTASAMAAPSDSPLKSNADFKYIGKEFTRLDALSKSTGTADYGIDVDVPNLHHAVMVRSPVVGAKLKHVDLSPAKNMPGVTDVVEVSNGIAVVAEKYWQAKTAAEALRPQWDEVPLAKVDSKRVRADYSAAIAKGQDYENAVVGPDEGDIAAAIDAAAHSIDAEYWTPFLAHAPLEPMNAVLRIENGEAEIWTGNQGPVGVQGLVARFAGLPPENVKVHNAYLGGGFGRRGTLTHVVEVTEIVMAVNKPVKLLWTREDDMRHGLYRPASLMKITAGVDADGKLTAWDAHRAGGNITPDTLTNMLPALFPGLSMGVIGSMVDFSRDIFTGWMADPSSIEGLFEDYDAANVRVTHATVDHGLPLTFWRSVGHSYTSFAKESAIDELAIAAGIDPVEFRINNTRNNPRLNNVIKVAAEAMRKMKPAEGHHLGFAAHHSFATDVAEIAEVSVDNGVIKVHKVTCVVDCGIAVNPDIVRAQMEGGIAFGLTAALMGEVNLEAGAVKESNFHDYPILRMNEAPDIDVIIVDSGTDPTGVGEPGLPPIAPAVANAVFHATGQRLRSLPLKLNA